MEEVRFFYSTDGTDVHGPVTEDELRVLARDRVVGMSSFLCREGDDTSWRAFNPQAFHPPILITRLPRYEPPPYVPTVQAKAKVEALTERVVGRKDEGPFPTLLTWACTLSTAGAAIILTCLQGQRLNYASSFVAALLVVGVLPFGFSRLFSRIWRLRAWAIGLVILATLTIVGQVRMNRIWHMEVTMRSIDDGIRDDARKQIATQGFYSGNMEQEEANLQKIKDAAGNDNSEMARMLRASVGVNQVMVQKIQVSRAAEQACVSFDPATFTSLVDLNTLRENIGKLRVTQVDVLTYLQNFDANCRASLAGGGFDPNVVEKVIAYARVDGHIDQAVAIWQLKIKLSDDHLTRLDFLDKHWGSWKAQDGKLYFGTQDDMVTYNALTKNLADDVKAGRDLQVQVFH